MKFEWNEEKAAVNLKKHGISFNEETTVFGDLLARIFDDDEHSFGEKRNGIFGRSNRNRLLLVSYAEKENDIIRITSAREATSKERRNYENADE